MIDLHFHLDGSLSADDFRYLAKKNNVELPSDFPDCIYVPQDCPSLGEYLKRFDLPLQLMQDKESISYCVESVITRMANLGYIYIEIRYAPQLHLQKGLTQKDVVEASIDGLNKGLAKNKDIDAGLILCCMRHGDEKTNLETIEAANMFKDKGVLAVDLAGNEVLHPAPYYKKVFDLAYKYGLNITIHGGEATGSDEVINAVEELHAQRIGHGVHLSLDDESVDIIKKNNVCFEFCPTSNLQTKSLKSYNDVPLRQFLEKDIPVTINSDNSTVSNTTVEEEFKHLIKEINLTKEEISKLLLNSVNNAFYWDKVKLIKKLTHRYESYYANLIK